MTSRATGYGAAILLCALSAASVRAQCQLANPSFELPGQNGALFGGWNQFGTVSASTIMVPHGHRSVGLTGPYSGGWAVSGVWQQLDAQPGQRWFAAVRVGHNSANPIVGDTSAIVNIEWRDAQGDLISYESHTVANASTPTGTMQRVQIESGPAPAGTAATHLLLGVLQGPTQDPGAAYYDLVEFYRLGSIDELQWDDFPGGRCWYFAGHWWRVKGSGYYGEMFSDGADHVRVDEFGRLHMTIRQVAGTWYSTEITAEEALGYGDYIYTTTGCLDDWDKNPVLGLFIWQYPICFDAANPWNLHNEIDVELSRLGDPNNDLAQFVVQPWEYAGNRERYALPPGYAGLSSHAFRWLPDRVECRSWLGGPTAEGCSTPLHTWTYTGPHIPRPEQPRAHINFWQPFGPPSNGLDHEVVIDAFTFVPACVDGVSSFHCIAACLAGPDSAVPSSCVARDLDSDSDVDLTDVALFQSQFAGS